MAHSQQPGRDDDWPFTRGEPTDFSELLKNFRSS